MPVATVCAEDGVIGPQLGTHADRDGFFTHIRVARAVDEALRNVCLGIAARYEITFIEIGADRDHVHFLMQSVPTFSPTRIVQTVKSLTAKEVFRRVPAVKRQLWGGAFWSSGFFVNTVGRYGGEEAIREYVKEQGRETEYRLLHSQQLELF